MSAAPIPWFAYFALSASMVLVGSYVGLSRLLVAVFPVFVLAWLRFAIAAVAMVHWVRRGPDEPALSPRERRLLFFESLVGNFLFSICMLYGVAATSALAAGVAMAAIPAFVALLSRIFDGEQLRPRVVAGIACAVAGIALLALARGGGASPTGEDRWWGYLLLIAAAFCEAGYVVIGKRLTAGLSPRRISALINLWGWLLVTPLALWQWRQFEPASVALPVWLLLVYYALAASMVGVWLWMQGLRTVPASRAGVFTVWLPITAAGVGVLWLGEAWGPGHVAALVLALTGLLLATWPQRESQGTR
jgi:drug/metabolite transporter (DMT)-like permease